MRVYSPSAGDGNSIVVRWLVNGKYGHAHGPASDGITMPRKADILCIGVTGPMFRTLQIAFDPDHAAFFADEAA